MRKIHIILVFFLLTMFALLLKADEVNVTGDWELTVKSPRGEMTSDVKFVQDGEKLVVTMKGPRGNEITGQGTVKGNEIEWSVTRRAPRGEMTSTYKGKVEGDTMTGEVQMGRFGSSEWSAIRKEE